MLVITNRFRDAIDLLTEEIGKKPSTALHNNRGMAYLHLREFQRALADFRRAEEISIKALGGECDKSRCGLALWMSGEREQAASLWAEGAQLMADGKIAYTDAAGGVSIGNLLWFAAKRLQNAVHHNLAIKLLRKKLRSKQSRAWPGPVSRFIVDTITEVEFRASVSSTPILRERQLCQAEFYIGVAAFGSDDRKYQQAMRLSSELGAISKLEDEYYLALHEMGYANGSHVS
jgi:tetratricopeptide (TPR) repeat protein